MCVCALARVTCDYLYIHIHIHIYTLCIYTLHTYICVYMPRFVALPSLLPRLFNLANESDSLLLAHSDTLLITNTHSYTCTWKNSFPISLFRATLSHRRVYACVCMCVCLCLAVTNFATPFAVYRNFFSLSHSRFSHTSLSLFVSLLRAFPSLLFLSFKFFLL